ncbi:Fic family protein [Sphingobacterium hungaricum]|uniref:Addiction module protein n=1 Tax=Sphingobacterium hungaricum TaxID=2082723 RepID=A0A928UVM3_9SPHI|nr:Fic/DOC family N-terminal domain-containing protein [Sphingobacterium hungaricum]MBE8712743.1 addiction module protein [Sphingobacterium hungaricum]
MVINVRKAYNSLPKLPPKHSLIESIAILKQESKSAVALAELKGLARTLPNQNILINAIVLKEAQASSEIENVITTQDKLYQALYAKSDKPDVATKEVLRYREALLMGTKLIKQKEFLNTNGIIEIQKELEENDAGLRKLPGTSLVNEFTNEVIYTPPDNFDVINALMKNLEDFINIDDDTSPLIKLAIQHYQFESIHPFYDGNGRTGRIINVLYLILNNLLNEPILYLSSYIIQNKADYYRLLQEVRTKKNWEGWILFILKGIEQTATETIETINKINSLFLKNQKLVQEKLSRIYSKDLIEQLFIHPYCKIEFLVDSLKINRKTASNYLKSLVDVGILEPETIGKEVIYMNVELYNLLKRGSK